MKPKFQRDDIIINEDGSETRHVIAVGKSKYFLTFPDKTENVTPIDIIDKLYRLESRVKYKCPTMQLCEMAEDVLNSRKTK